MKRQIKDRTQAEELKQFYAAYARKVVPGIPDDCPDKRCLILLLKHIKRMNKFLSLFPPTLNKEMNGVTQACQFYIAYADVSVSRSQRVKVSFARWLEILYWINKNREFIKQDLYYYGCLSDDLKQLKNNKKLF